MYHFEYVTKKEAAPFKNELIRLINEVQDYVREEYFTFKYYFIGSSSRNMITFDPTTNIGFDFDVNIEINDNEERYDPSTIRKVLMDAFSKLGRKYGFNKCENSARVFTIKNIDIQHSKIQNSCDIAVVYNYEGGQQYIRFNKNAGNYYWEQQKQPYYDIKQREEKLKKTGYWDEVLEVYLDKKNNNNNPDKHSRSLYAETINECYKRNLG